MAKGREEGLAEGMEKGRAEGEFQKALAIARNMKTLGLSNEQIFNITGISIDD